MVVSYTTTILRVKEKALPSGKAITLQSTTTNFSSEWCRCGDSGYSTKSPLSKGDLGGLYI